MQKVWIGVDVGGTNTRIEAINGAGKTLVSHQTSGSNPHHSSHGQSVEQIITAILAALEKIEPTTVKAICIGMAGLDTPYDAQQLRQYFSKHRSHDRLKQATIILVPDTYIALKSGTTHQPALSLIAGTGASCYGIDANGKEYKAGNWGHLAGDQGSAFAIGQFFLKQAIKELDGRQKSTAISPLVRSHFHSPNLIQLIEHLHRSDNLISDIAGLAVLIEHDSIYQDPACEKLIIEVVNEMTSSVGAVYSHFTHQRLSLVCIGGLFQFQSISGAFKAQIKEMFPELSLIFPEGTPTQAAVRIAQSHSILKSSLPKSALILD
jgi:N-acetylglucosamine kinase-like BadF-type ATPase